MANERDKRITFRCTHGLNNWIVATYGPGKVSALIRELLEEERSRMLKSHGAPRDLGRDDEQQEQKDLEPSLA